MKPTLLLAVLAVLINTGCSKIDWKSADKIRVNGVRLDPDFSNTGVLHLSVSGQSKDGKHLEVDTEKPDLGDVSVVLNTAEGVVAASTTLQLRIEITGVPRKGSVPVYSGILVDNSGSNASGSINDTDPKGTRFGGAARAVKSLCAKKANKTYVGLFGPSATDGFSDTRIEPQDANRHGRTLLRDCGNTADIDGLLAALDAVKSRGAEGGTPLYSSLRENVTFLANAAEKGGNPKALVLTSDGQPMDSPLPTDQTHVEKSGVTIFTLGYGPSSLLLADGKPNPTREAGAVSVLQQIAQWSNGYYLSLTSTGELEDRIDALTASVNGGYVSIKVVIENPRVLASGQIIRGTLKASQQADDFSFLVP